MNFPRQLPPFSERLIYYILAPELFSRVFLEAGAGIYWYSITQPKQWVFYIFMLVEYMAFFPRLLNLKFKKDVNILAFALVILMFFHGITVGFFMHNSIPKILTDSIPILVLAINTLILSADESFEGFAFNRVVTLSKVYAITMVVVGLVAVKMGRPSTVSLGGAAGTPLCLTLILVGMAQKRSISFIDVLMLGLIVGPIAPNLTRTALVSFFAALIILLTKKIFANVLTVYLTTIVVVISALALPFIVPADSPVMRRIDALWDSKESSQTEGSIGERRAEFAAINEKLRSIGSEAEWLGAGAGGTYYVEFSDGNIPVNYSNAHFGWALFKLRYGYVGYFYLTIFTCFIIINLLKNLQRQDPLGKTVAVIDFWSLVFVFTYMFFNQLIAGLQFASPPLPARRRVAVEEKPLPSLELTPKATARR